MRLGRVFIIAAAEAAMRHAQRASNQTPSLRHDRSIFTLMRVTYLLTVLALFMVAGCVSDKEPEWSLASGDAAPLFNVTMNDGSQFGTSDMYGHTSLIVFFNTGCSDCRNELPQLQTVYESLPDGCNLVCIAREEERDAIEAYWSDNGLTLPYSPQPDRRVFNMFAGSGIPHIYIINHKTIITAVYGPDELPSAQTLLQQLREAYSVRDL